jgi:hypothetical protein
MARRYAEGTTVSSEKSRSEIERTLSRYGATAFMYGWEGNAAAIMFHARGRRIRFRLPLPDKGDRKFTHSSVGRRTDALAEKQWEQACRQAWRALALVIKAKLEAVEAGITEFETEFLVHTVLPDGHTVGEHIDAPVRNILASNEMRPLLPHYPGSSDASQKH